MTGLWKTVVKVAIYAGITLGTSVFIYSQVAKLGGGPRYELIATFDDVTGLFKDDDVKVAGVPVGKVTGIKSVDGRAQVTFAVKKSVKVPVDSTAVMRWRNPLGQRFVYVLPGASTELLSDGDRVEKTSSVVDLGDFINKLGPLTRTVAPEKLNELFLSLNQAFTGNEGNYDALVSDLDALFSALAPRQATIAQLMTDYGTISETIARRDQQIKTVIDDLVAVSKAFAGNSDVLDRALVQLSGLTDGLGAALGGKADEIGRIIDNLAVLGNLTADHIREIEATLAGFPDAAKALFSILSAGEFARINLPCVQDAPPPCKHPMVLSGSGSALAERPALSVIPAGPGRLDSAPAFSRFMVGVQ